MAIQGNFPSIRPSLVLDFANSKRLDPRVTFTRASTATYYDGVTVSKAEENLFTQSQGFNETAWGKTNSTVTANTTTAPDGTSTADTFTPNATTAFFRVNQTSTFAGPITVSAFVKANGYSKVAIREDNATGSAATFDLSTGAVIGVVNAGAVTVSNNTITALADSWYRISCTFTGAGSLGGAFLILDPSYTSGSVTATWAANGTSGIFIWGAQLEQRSAVTAYTATTTQAITNYVPKLQTAAANVARFDHTPTTGAALGLLVEESRVNSATYSEDFSNAAWVKTRTTVSTNQAIAPDGTLTADNLIPSTDNNTHYTFQSLSLSAIAYTMSVYAKANGYNFVAVGIDNDDATFNLTTGEITNIRAGATASVTSVGNGWYRCSTTRTVTAGTRLPIIYATSNSTNASFAGNAYSGIFIWGAQLEAGSFATSYIPTVASTVTRSADAASMTGTNFSSWYDAAEGTLYGEAIGFGAGSGGATALMQVDDGTTNNRIAIGMLNTSTTGALVTVGGSSQVGISVSFTASYNKNVFAYKVNDFAQSLNGGAVQTDTSGLIPVVSVMRIASNATSANNVCVRKLAYYPTRLTNAQLQAITG